MENNLMINERAVKALRVVLSHWMLPDLGWHMHHFQDELPKLRDAILQHEREFWPTVQNQKDEMDKIVDVEERINTLQWNLCNTSCYIDDKGCDQRKKVLSSLDRSEFTPPRPSLSSMVSNNPFNPPDWYNS
jgi:hypothetical protein